MKKIVFLLFFIASISMNCKSQNFSLPIDSTGDVSYQEVVNSNLSKDQLYANAQEWIAKTFGDYKNVIQFEDKKNGKLILKGTSYVKHYVEVNIAGMNISNSERIQFTLTIECRDNKYRYTLDNIFVIFSTSSQDFERSIFYRINNVESSKKKIEHLNQVLENLKNMDITSYKKKQLKEHQNKINIIEQQIKDELSNIETDTEFINSELESINSVITSLKKAMSKNDKF